MKKWAHLEGLMRRTWLIPVTALLVSGCGNSATPPTTRTLVLLHTNDEHSHLIGNSPELDDFPAPTSAGTGAIKGGVGRRAVVFKQERDAATAAGADTLTVSAGDNSQSTLFQIPFARSAPDYAVMQQLTYDVTTLGNHEFDVTPKGLANAINVAQAAGNKMHIVATNMNFDPTDPGDDTLQAIFDESGTDATKMLHRSWTITTPNGLKVGFLGVMGADAANSAPFKNPVSFSRPAGVKDSQYDQIEAQAWKDLQAAVDKLRAAKADVVVLLSHAGVDITDMTKGEDYLIAQNVTGIDVIVSGHTHVTQPILAVTNPTTNKPVYIQQANCFGYDVGKITLSVDKTGAVTVDTANSKVIPVDDTIVGDTSFDSFIGGLMRDLESTKVAGPGMSQSFLEHTLTEIMGMPVMDNGTLGNLFFMPIGKVGFDIVGQRYTPQELPLDVLIADGVLAAGDKYKPAGGKANDIGVIAGGALRADLLKGKTGNIAFTDLFDILPLGLSPTDGSAGYSLTRFSVYPAELRAALELTTSYAYSTDNASGFYLVTSGLKMEYDTSKAPFDFAGNALDPNNGRVTKIWLQTDHVTDPDAFPATPIYDATNAVWVAGASKGWNPATVPDPFSALFTLVASQYIAEYAASQGVHMKDDSGAMIDIAAATLHRTDGTEIKDWEVLGEYIRSFPSQTIPSRYDATQSTFPKRMICDGPLCLK
jgi:5'-nucleotidase